MRINVKVAIAPDKPTASLPEALTIDPFKRAIVPTGIILELPMDYEAQVRPRSGVSYNFGLLVVLGTIDQDFRGEVGVICINTNPDKPLTIIEPDDRIAQLVFAPVARAWFTLVSPEDLSPTGRGAKGHGSTGV